MQKAHSNRLIILIREKIYLEIYDNAKDENCSQQIHQVWKILPIEGFSKTPDFISASCKKMKECNDGTFKLSS